MTLTVAWWVLPIVITIIGFVYSIYDLSKGGWYAGIWGLCVLIGCIMASLGIVLGHYL